MALPVNEIFSTIQGEATYTGTASTFVRLQGCSVGCGWCDTKHTWDLKLEDKINVKDMLAKDCDSKQYAVMTDDELLNEVNKRRPTHVVITGGEPFNHDLYSVTKLLTSKGYTVQVETSGTRPIRAHGDTFITLSPKWDMAGGFDVIEQNYWRADEIKVPVGKQADVEKIWTKIPVDIMCARKPIWLQPLSQSSKATDVCVASALQYDFKISIQTHKFIGVR